MQHVLSFLSDAGRFRSALLHSLTCHLMTPEVMGVLAADSWRGLCGTCLHSTGCDFNGGAPVLSSGLFQVMMVVAAMGMHFAGNMNKFGNAGKTFSYVVS